MKHILFLAGLALALAFTSCTENYTDEQMEVAAMMNKGGKDKTAKILEGKGPDKNIKNNIMLCAPSKVKETKTEKVQKDPFARGKNKNAEKGVEPCAELTTRSMIIYKPFPNPDKSATKDIPPTKHPLR